MTEILSASLSVNSSEFSERLKKIRAQVPVLLVGYGPMGHAYFDALKFLSAEQITICKQTPIDEASDVHSGIEWIYGGYKKISAPRSKQDVAIVATPIGSLSAVLKHLLSVGYKKILCEKPISLYSSEIKALADHAARANATVWCAFNRLAYPSFIEARRRAEEERIRSCHYIFTERANQIGISPVAPEILARWGVANSLHVLSLAHGLIGLPHNWKSDRLGGFPWHPSGDLFSGSGVSDKNVPFIYQADWKSPGRWSVEFTTEKSIYRLCPLEELYRKKENFGEWEKVALTTTASWLKSGFLEQTAGLFDEGVASLLPLWNLDRTATLVRYAEDVFGYPHLC